MPIPSESVLSFRAYAAMRRGIGDSAYWLEGIARISRRQAAAIDGVGVSILAEVDAALLKHDLDWAEPADSFRALELEVPSPPEVGRTLSGSSQSRHRARSERKLVRTLVAAALRNDDDEVTKLLSTFKQQIRQACGNQSPRAEMLINRIFDGMTLEQTGLRFAVTRERVRQQTAPLDNRGLAAIQRSVARTALRQHTDELVHLFRTGLTPREAAQRVASENPWIPVTALSELVSKNPPFTTRDRSINWVMRRSSRRPSDEQWSNSQILAAIRRVATDYCDGRGPTVNDYEAARVSERLPDGSYTMPSIPLIGTRFRSWNRARVLAGFPVPIRGPRSDKSWTSELILARLFDLVRELDELPSRQRFDVIARQRHSLPSASALPSSGTVCIELGHEKIGKWEDIRAMIYQSLIDMGEWKV